MSNYDFSSLDPIDFEKVVRDLLSKENGFEFEIFKQGKDSGIDARYSKSSDRATIVQCKHYLKSGFQVLKYKMLNEELAKIKRLNPKRYILTTSVPLNPGQKEELQNILAPFCISTSDIKGQDDLNALLRTYPEVEQAHFKLWISSSAVLERILKCKIFTQSYFTEDAIKKKISLFVEDPMTISKAQSILATKGTLIISGPPGIGKTTLAEILIGKLIKDGFDVVSISQDMNEAFEIDHRKDGVVYSYDDFLGEVDLLNKNEDGRLVTFMKHIEAEKNKKFILTTREHLFQEATKKFHKLSAQEIELSKMTIGVDSYSLIVKARILYKHLYFLGVEQSYIDQLLDKGKLHQIVGHKNFTPRIIETVCKDYLNARIKEVDFFQGFIDTLNNPDKLWRLIFEEQLDVSGRNILFSLATFESQSNIVELERAFNKFHQNTSKHFNRPIDPLDFKRSLKILEGTFIKISKPAGLPIIEFQNPSVRDFVKKVYKEMHEIFNIAWDSALYLGQRNILWSIAKNDLELIKIIKNNAALNFDSQINLLNKQESRTSIQQYEVKRSFELLFDFYEMMTGDKKSSKEQLLTTLVTYVSNGYLHDGRLILSAIHSLMYRKILPEEINSLDDLLEPLELQLFKSSTIRIFNSACDAESYKALGEYLSFFPFENIFEDREELSASLVEVVNSEISNLVESYQLDYDEISTLKSSVEELADLFDVSIDNFEIRKLERAIEGLEQGFEIESERMREDMAFEEVYEDSFADELAQVMDEFSTLKNS